MPLIILVLAAVGIMFMLLAIRGYRLKDNNAIEVHCEEDFTMLLQEIDRAPHYLIHYYETQVDDFIQTYSGRVKGFLEMRIKLKDAIEDRKGADLHVC